MVLACCKAVARVFYVVARGVVSVFFILTAMQFHGHSGWLLGGC